MEILFDENMKKNLKNFALSSLEKINFFIYAQMALAFFFIKLKCGIFKPTKKQDGLVSSSIKGTQGFSQY